MDEVEPIHSRWSKKHLSVRKGSRGILGTCTGSAWKRLCCSTPQNILNGFPRVKVAFQTWKTFWTNSQCFIIPWNWILWSRFYDKMLGMIKKKYLWTPAWLTRLVNIWTDLLPVSDVCVGSSVFVPCREMTEVMISSTPMEDIRLSPSKDRLTFQVPIVYLRL